MVAWKNLFPDKSGPPGGVGAYIRLVTSAGARRALFDATQGVKLTSGGTVNTNAPMRGQYLIGGFNGPQFSGSAGFSYSADDASAAASAGVPYMTATMFVAPASALSGTPSPNQIRLAATMVIRGQGNYGSPNYRTAAGDSDYIFIGATGALPPNTKYWVAVYPTSLADPGSTPSIANDPPMFGGDSGLGRAVSVWTNRTPLAPVITEPVGQTTTFPGQTVTLKFSPKDPDRVQSYEGDTGIPDFEDMAGFQIQYRARPADEEDTTGWADLPIADLTGQNYGKGWYFDDLPVLGAVGGNEGAYYAWRTRRLPIRCGDVAGFTAVAAELPPGDWEVRVRTFDYGHNRPDSADLFSGSNPGSPPLNDASHSYTPDNYPAVNTSPWSVPVRIFINAQVPKPLALTPRDNIAVRADQPLTMVWQYRNTYVPPYPQKHRTVQLQRIGDNGWFTLVDEDSASNSYTLPSGLISGNQYMWRVQTTDESGRYSEYSDPAYFWAVPSPASGEVIPAPLDTLDGATLGCGKHRVFIFRRGGKVRVGEIRGVSRVEWNRLRDDISVAKINIRDWDIDCGNLLSVLEPWAYEVVIVRDNGFSTDRVWEGPITLLTYERGEVTIQAKDVFAYAYRRIVKQAVNDSGNSPTAGDKVTSRAARVLQSAFAPDDPNLLAYMHVLTRDDDAKQYRSLPAYSKTAYEEVDDMAANAGLDYTAVGRSILLWGTKHRIGTLPEFRDEDLGSPPIVSVYGMSMANVYAVSDGNGVWGEADRLDEEGKDEKYGLVEMLSSTWASDSAAEQGTYTEEGLNTVRESFAQSAERSIADRYPPPVVVRVPDNTRLNAGTVISIQHLVPGVVIPLRSTGTLRTVVASQKLDAVKVVEVDGKEDITITMSPFSRDDAAPGEGEEA